MAWSDLLQTANGHLRDHFGSSVVYTPASTGVPEFVSGIFDAAAVVTATQGGMTVQATHPTLDIVLTDLTVAPAKGDALTVSGRSWLVARVEPDGNGMTALRLTVVP